jgi:hypothetical protein
MTMTDAISCVTVSNSDLTASSYILPVSVTSMYLLSTLTAYSYLMDDQEMAPTVHSLGIDFPSSSSDITCNPLRASSLATQSFYIKSGI